MLNHEGVGAGELVGAGAFVLDQESDGRNVGVGVAWTRLVLEQEVGLEPSLVRPGQEVCSARARMWRRWRGVVRARNKP